MFRIARPPALKIPIIDVPPPTSPPPISPTTPTTPTSPSTMGELFAEYTPYFIPDVDTVQFIHFSKTMISFQVERAEIRRLLIEMKESQSAQSDCEIIIDLCKKHKRCYVRTLPPFPR